MAKDSGKLKVLFALQDECKNNLVKAETNFKKSPRDRLKRPYLEARLESLESLYYSFKEGHKAIVSETLTDRNHPYFIEDKYENFEELYIHDELPTWEQLREYLESRFRSLEMIDTNVTRTTPARTTPAAKPKAFHASIENKCKMCQENHFLNQCKEYGLLTPNKRQDFVQSNKLCFNCLSPTHSVAKCRLPTSCKRCGRRHHTTLHYERENRDSNQQTTAANERDGATVTSRDYQPTQLSTPSWSDIDNLPLADPTYATPGKIEVLLGADVYSEIILEGVIKQTEGSLMAQNTVFGWIISGKVTPEPGESSQANFTSMHIHIEEDDLLKKFWEMENEPNTIQKEMTESEKLCEKIFEATTVRDEEGRFVVRLPFATDDPKSKYGHSEEIAIKRLESLERKLSRDPKLREEYNKVFQEYLTLNHMRPVYEHELENNKAVYLPHHAVIREDKETTKLRIVFNASSKGDNNVSLNDDLLVGPKLQQDLRHILMRWRNHKICLIADIVKMYRMICVADEHTDFQRIVWRFTSNEPIQHFKLLRLTFGTACAPYLAVKALQSLAKLEEDRYPLAAKLTKTDYYMDDLITGANTESEALQIYDEMNRLMKLGGFKLQKWNSNCENIVEKIQDKNEQNGKQVTPIKLNKTIKVLGVSWCRITDNFVYTVELPDPKEPITKRKVLADVAKLYDPEGWIAPVVVNAKKFIQTLWKSGLLWDQSLPEDILSEWLEYRSSLADLRELKIPRWFNATPGSKQELHVFSDASKSAFAAAVYIRVTDESNNVHVHLVTAKTKVAPIEKEITIPRLELCGATLATKLIWEVSQVMEIPKEHLFGWTDSTIVLAWLRGGASRWTTFVSNRVSTILNIMNVEQWNHVPTESNPADCASRGVTPRDLIAHPLWWQGPQWLSKSKLETNTTSVEDTHEEEKVKALTVSTNIEEDFIWSRFSSLSRLLKVLSYCRRVKIPRDERLNLPKFITVDELRETLLICVKQVQQIEFESEIKHLKAKGCVPKKSPLRTLCPFLDEKGILRVSGRISHSDIYIKEEHSIDGSSSRVKIKTE
ncbi:uncharacterized protein LOC135074871 [Ostrinia nubilalis]|uniref:uncharacterized protein LOC135074871 n=1 Tax=Ostrinia nubilalis TaxID=29057 RepID=UPI0030823AFE